MKLPRWLSPVRMVEAKTGWPRAVCRRYLKKQPCLKVKGRLPRISVAWVFFVPFVIMPACGVLAESIAPPFVIPMLDPLAADEGLWPMVRGLLLPLMIYTFIPGLVFGGLLGALLLGGLRLLSVLALPQYLAAPWCFKCNYPVPGVNDGRPCAICPECGEPIPPEIAKLAAKRESA